LWNCAFVGFTRVATYHNARNEKWEGSRQYCSQDLTISTHRNKRFFERLKHLENAFDLDIPKPRAK